jgi:hypothetical protein
MDELTAREITGMDRNGITLKFPNNPAEAPLFELVRASHQIELTARQIYGRNNNFYCMPESSSLEL